MVNAALSERSMHARREGIQFCSRGASFAASTWPRRRDFARIAAASTGAVGVANGPYDSPRTRSKTLLASCHVFITETNSPPIESTGPARNHNRGTIQTIGCSQAASIGVACLSYAVPPCWSKARPQRSHRTEGPTLCRVSCKGLLPSHTPSTRC